MQPKRLIKDIEPNGSFGRNLLKEKNPDEIIDAIVEEPLRKACKIFRSKGIETVMSSANKNNVLKPGEKPKEKEDVIGREMYLNRPTFEDAGRGYAWVMLNYNSLSPQNKDMLFLLEQRKDPNGENIGERIVWFIYDWVGKLLSFDSLDNKSEAEKRFDARSFALAYNDRYPDRTVILRMPVTEETTVEEVERHFVQLAELFKQQELEKPPREEEGQEP